MCRMLEVSTSGYYAWLRRPPSKRSQEDDVLIKKIREYHRISDGTYGSPRILKDLREEGIRIGKKRVARLMRETGLQGVTRRKSVWTTVREPGAEPAPDLVQRKFSVDKPDQLWVADITYIRSWAGFMYLAIVMDAWSRRIVGWSTLAPHCVRRSAGVANHLRTELVLDALGMAIEQRRPKGVIHHSDQGSQYTSFAFGKRCQEVGIRPSMGSAGDCYDNALAESFFATLECELLDRRKFRTREEASRAVFAFIEGWYNPRRRHSSLGQVSPMRYEKEYALAA
jgi:putative transposase